MVTPLRPASRTAANSSVGEEIGRLLVLGDEDAGPLVDRLQLGRERVELARLGALDQRPVDDVALLHAAQAAA